MLTETSAHTQIKICGSYHYHVRVEQVTCVGNAVTEDGGALQYVKARIKRANGIFVELHTLWKNKNILMKTKIRIFNINVKSVRSYGCETWKVVRQITNKLQTFVNRCLRRIMGIRWPKIRSNTE